jgi:putative peptidoglycan lipid II flippase
VNVALNLTLVRFYSYKGLALGTSITAIVNASIQLFLLRRELHGIDGSRIAASFLKVTVASAAMGVVTWSVYEVMIGMLPGESLMLQIARLLVTIALSLATLAGVAQVLRIQEFGEARDLVLGRLKRMVG